MYDYISQFTEELMRDLRSRALRDSCSRRGLNEYRLTRIEIEDRLFLDLTAIRVTKMESDLPRNTMDGFVLPPARFVFTTS